MEMEFQSMPGHLVRRLNQMFVSIFDDKMKENGFDLTPVQFAALNTINARTGIDQTGLAKEIAYDRATIGGVVDRLERKGLLNRKVGATDRRSRKLQLTAAGQTVLERVSPLVVTLQNEVLAGLDGEERQLLLNLLNKATRFHRSEHSAG